MSFFVERFIIKNRAPFDALDLQLEDKTLNVLTALNGKGKTTILSYIVDAWVEITKESYGSSYVGKESSYYRVSTSLYDIDKSQPSIVYIRFRNNGVACDYLDVRNLGQQEWYEKSIPMDDRVPYGELQSSSQRSNAFKYISDNLRKKKDAQAIFDNNITTYFPSYRFEIPNYLNDKFQPTKFSVESKYNGYLSNPLEVMSDIKDIANWIMDVLVDWEINKEEHVLENGSKIIIQPEREIWMNVKRVLECALISKFPSRNVRFGIGRRNNSGSRVSIMEIIPGGDKLYCPSMFNLSSGELAVIAIFAEIIRQADIAFGMVPLSDIHGIVLIDEVDKHLHIQLQKEALPLLFALFPNVQFIVSSHSPFLNMGLSETMEMAERTHIIDLDNGGIESTPTSNEVYESAYQLFLNEKNRYADEYKKLQSVLEQATKPLVITEGKTDIKHIVKAMSKLGIEQRFDIMPEDKQPDGSSNLKTLIDNVLKTSIIGQPRKIIAIFDRDEPKMVSEYPGPYKELGNNVYAFCIPCPQSRTEQNRTAISIEYMYSDDEIHSKLPDGTHLFFGNEFNNDSTRRHLVDKALRANEKKGLGVDKIIENNGGQAVFDNDDVNHLGKKDAFAVAIVNDQIAISDESWNNFKPLIDIINEIIDK